MSLGGSSPQIPQQKLSSILSDVYNSFNKQALPYYRQFGLDEPLLSAGTDFALRQGGNLEQQLARLTPSTMWTDQLQQQLTKLPNVGELQGPLQEQLAGLQQQAGGMPNINQLTRPLQQRIGGLVDIAPTLQQAFAGLAPIITSGGAPTEEQQRSAQQAAFGNAALQGNLYGNQANVADVLNRWDIQQKNLQSAIQNVGALQGAQTQDVATRQGLAQTIEGLRTQDITNRVGLGQGTLGLAQGIQGLQGTDIGQRLQLAGGIQGLQGSDIAQRLSLGQGISGLYGGQEQTNVGSFATLLNPLTSTGADVAAANQNAAAAQSIAAGNKGSSALGAGLSLVGSAAAAY